MVEVKILRTTKASGILVEKGKTVEVSDRDAQILISLGKAEKAGKAKDKDKG